MKAKFPGVCKCGAKFPRYAEVGYNYQSKRIVECPACKDKSRPAEPDLGRMFDMAYEDQCRDACGL